MNDREFLTGCGIFVASFIIYLSFGAPHFITGRLVMFLSIVLFSGILIYSTRKAQRGERSKRKDGDGREGHAHWLLF